MKDNNDVVIIKLDRPRVVWFGHRALKMLGSLLGKTLNELSEFLINPDFDAVEKIMYCGLLSDAKRNNETLKLEDMEEILDYAPYYEINDAMNKAIQANFGSFEDEIKN